MDDRVREAIFRRVAEEPFAQKFGLKLVALDDGHSRVEMRFTPDMENLFGMAHGGALFASSTRPSRRPPIPTARWRSP